MKTPLEAKIIFDLKDKLDEYSIRKLCEMLMQDKFILVDAIHPYFSEVGTIILEFKEKEFKLKKLI